MVRHGRKQKARDEEMFQRHSRYLEKELILDEIRQACSNAYEPFLSRFGDRNIPLTLNMRRALIKLCEYCRKYNG